MRTLDITVVGMHIANLHKRLPLDLARIQEHLSAQGAQGERLVVLPPLIANVLACERYDERRALLDNIVADSRPRILRRAAIKFTYPSARASHLPWLTQHDRVHQVLRGPLARFAQEGRAITLAGTAVMDHPRTHWEAWPDTGNLFHTAWAFEPNGEPCPHIRQPRPNWVPLRAIGLDEAEREQGRALRTSMGPIGLDWGRKALASTPHPLIWSPSIGAAEGHCAIEQFRSQSGSPRVLVRSVLTGLDGGGSDLAPAVAVRMGEHHVDLHLAHIPTAEEPLAIAHTSVQLSPHEA